VEALVGADAYQFLAKEHLLVTRLSELVKAPADQIVERVEKTIASLKDAEKDLARVRSAQLTASVDGIIGEGRDVGPVRLWDFVAPEGTTANDLREMLAKIKGRGHPRIPIVVIGAAVADGKVALIAGASPQAIELGITANVALQAALPSVEGRGGGKEEMAQGGGTNPDGIDAALAAVEALIRERTGQ
jgi:alanyl-tRNA synthetase